MRFTDKFTEVYKKLLPTPFSIAIILTLITFLLALIFTRPEGEGMGSYSIALLQSWEEGLWNDTPGGIYFAFQMMFMLIMGYIIALSEPVNNLIKRLIQPCTNNARAAAIVTAATILASLFNWGLGLIFGAILARKVGEKFRREGKKLNYPLIGAAAYSGLMVWHGGLSGSAPIKAAKDGNIKSLVEDMDVKMSTIPDKVDMSQTVFSTMNIVVSLALIILLPALFYFVAKRKNVDYENLPEESVSKKEEKVKAQGAERIDHSNIFGILIGLVILFYAFHKALIQPEEISLAFLTPNFFNFFLFGIAFIVHRNINGLLKAAGEAISGATGILLQFPLYFGILALMVSSGLLIQISEWFAESSSVTSFPILTFFSAGFVNVFIPSGGGQWAVQGPVIIQAAQDLGVSYPKVIMALSYGDQLTNMIQPFWAIPLLAITGLKAKEILPYTLLLFLAGGVIFISGLLIF